MATNPTEPSLAEEAQIESTVRELLRRLDGELETANNWGCSTALLVLVPANLLVLWWGLQWSFWWAIGLALVDSLILWGLFSAGYESHAVQREAANFTRRFPPDHPHRELAVRMLSEMPYPNRANEKLREQLS